MSLQDYTGTTQAVNVTIYPSSSNKYYLPNLPDSISSITAYAITDTKDTKDGATIAIEDEYALTIADSRDTYIKVYTSGTISGSTLQIQHKEGVSGSWSSPYTPTNPQTINGVSYSFDSSSVYNLGANWYFKIWKLEPIVYIPVTNTQLLINLATGECNTNANEDYSRIALTFNSLGSIIRVNTIRQLVGNSPVVICTSAPSSIVLVGEGVVNVGYEYLSFVSSNPSILINEKNYF